MYALLIYTLYAFLYKQAIIVFKCRANVPCSAEIHARAVYDPNEALVSILLPPLQAIHKPRTLISQP